MFIANEQLKAELEKSIEGGKMTEEFATMACTIAEGHISKQFPEVRNLHQDFLSAFHEAIVKNWKRISPDGNIHAYISTLTSRRALNVIRSEKKQMRRKADAAYLRDKYILKPIGIDKNGRNNSEMRFSVDTLQILGRPKVVN